MLNGKFGHLHICHQKDINFIAYFSAEPTSIDDELPENVPSNFVPAAETTEASAEANSPPT